MALHNWINKKGNVKSRELRNDQKYSPLIPIFEDQKPVRYLVHLLGGRPVLFQLSKTVYNRSRAEK